MEWRVYTIGFLHRLWWKVDMLSCVSHWRERIHSRVDIGGFTFLQELRGKSRHSFLNTRFQRLDFIIPCFFADFEFRRAPFLLSESIHRFYIQLTLTLIIKWNNRS